MFVLPSSSQSSFLVSEASDLVGTLTWRLVDSTGATVIAASTTGITEGPSGTYRHDYLAPITAGLYQPIWNDGSQDLPDDPIVVVTAAVPFTEVTVSGSYRQADGNPASGSLTFTLTQPMSNGGVTIPPVPLVAELDAAGNFSKVLVANDDPDTVPLGVLYGVTEQIDSGVPRDYFISVPSAATAVDLSTLMPGQPGWE